MIRQFKMLAARFIVRAVPGKKGVGMGVGLERNMKMGYHQHNLQGTVHMDIPGNTPTHLILIDLPPPHTHTWLAMAFLSNFVK